MARRGCHSSANNFKGHRNNFPRQRFSFVARWVREPIQTCARAILVRVRLSDGHRGGSRIFGGAMQRFNAMAKKLKKRTS